MLKDSGSKITIPDECLCFGISSVQQKIFRGSKFWLLILDKCTDIRWIYFLKRKSDPATTMMEFIKDLRSKHGKKNATIIRCDNASEKNHIKSYLRRKDWVLKFNTRHMAVSRRTET